MTVSMAQTARLNCGDVPVPINDVRKTSHKLFDDAAKRDE
jgi:hypothetical protein